MDKGLVQQIIVYNCLLLVVSGIHFDGKEGCKASG